MSEFKFESSNEQKNGYLTVIRTLGAVTHDETDMSTVLKPLSHTGHVGMLG